MEAPQTRPLWTYVPARDYAVPEAPIEQQVRFGLAVLRDRLRRRDAVQPAVQEPHQPLAASALERIVPRPDWQEAVPALREALRPWQEAGGGEPALLLTAPHDGQQVVLRAWADEEGWRVVEPPPDRFPDRDTGWLTGLESGAPWVLPCLERCYLRRHDGLALVRRLLDAWTGGALGRGLVGCDRWAWAYLQRVWPGQIPTVLTLQAFDHERLARWFRALAGAGADPTPRFLQSDNGKEVVPSLRDGAGADDASPFLRNLAAHSRGLPGVAWALWRGSLLQAPEADPGEAPRDPAGPGTIWVRPWSRLDRPALPSGAGRDDAFLLHALLLHGGLAEDPLARLLPLSPHTVRQRLYLLRDAALVERAGPVWRVTAPGYPAVRQFLRDEGYLTD